MKLMSSLAKTQLNNRNNTSRRTNSKRRNRNTNNRNMGKPSNTPKHPGLPGKVDKHNNKRKTKQVSYHNISI